MEFDQHDISLILGDQPHRVIVAGDALQFWWGADTGPQSAEELVAAHIGEVEAIAAAKLARGAVAADGSIIVADEDLE